MAAIFLTAFLRPGLVLSDGQESPPEKIREKDGAAGPELEPLSREELEARREALKKRIFEPAILEASSFRLIFERGTSSFIIVDGRTGIGWHTSLGRKGFASVFLNGEESAFPIDQVEDLRVEGRLIRFLGRSTKGKTPPIHFQLQVLQPLVGLEVSFEVAGEEAGRVSRIRLLDGALWIADSDGGGVILPRGLGEWISAGEGPDFRRRFRRQDGPWSSRTSFPEPATLSTLGMVRSRAALCLTWESSDTELEVKRGSVDDPGFPGRKALDCTLHIPGPKGSVRIFPLGEGDWIEIAHSYRQLIRREKEPLSLRAKTAGREDLQTILGAAILRPRIALRDTSGIPRILRSLEEVAALAERWRKVLEIDQALIILDGWSEGEMTEGGGPLLPAASLAGGTRALSEFTRRVKALGYLTGLKAQKGEKLAGALEDLKTQVPTDILLVPAGLRESDAEFNSPEELSELGERIQKTLGLAGTDGAGELWPRNYGYLEGLLEHKVSRPAGDLVFPLFGFIYGHCARITVRPENAVAPDQPRRLLAHLALGEVPIYALPEKGNQGPADQSGGGKNLLGDPRWGLSRSDGGWAEGMGLTPRECFIKNTFEVLSHVARIRYREPLLYRRFLTDDQTVEDVYFGPDLRIVVNYGDGEYTDKEGDFKLPPYGFWVQHPFFHAFYATRAHGVDYQPPALFTVRSLEGKMYLRAESVRIYHGFGATKIRLGGRNFEVVREGVVKIW